MKPRRPAATRKLIVLAIRSAEAERRPFIAFALKALASLIPVPVSRSERKAVNNILEGQSTFHVVTATATVKENA